jgi:hypothetical protein
LRIGIYREMKGKLHKRTCGNRSGIINNVNDIVYQRFNQPGHSNLSMRVRIIEKIYHRTSNPNLTTPLHRQREDYWIRELGTATPNGCNDKIDGIGILSSPTCRSVNVMDIFNSGPRRKRSHGHRHFTYPIFHDVSLNDLLPLMQKPLGMHHIRSKLFYLPLSKLHALYNSCLVNNVMNPNSNEYKLTTIVLDIAGHIHFKPVGIKKVEIDKRSFL